jgi:hypothetical protein
VLINNRKRPEASTIKERVRDKIHRPAIVLFSLVGTLQTVSGSPSPLGAFAPEVQIGLAIKPVDPFVVDVPAFTFEQHRDPPVAIADPHGGYFFNPPSYGGVIVDTSALIAKHRTVRAQDPCCTPFAHPVGMLQLHHQVSLLGQRYNFFESTS